MFGEKKPFLTGVPSWAEVVDSDERLNAGSPLSLALQGFLRRDEFFIKLGELCT